jgi:fucose 4-O-acetylase-like acetyltransferase
MPALAPPGTRKRMVALDVAKLVAITAVVFNHTCTEEVFHAGMQLTRFGNHAFTAISCYLAFGSGHRSQIGKRGRWMLGRITSLYALFLIWNSVGLVARIAGALHAGEPNPFTWDEMLLSGFTLGLWFLPFIAIANCFAYGVGAHLSSSIGERRLWIWVGLLLGAGLALALSPAYTRIDFPIYFCSIALKNIPTTLMMVGLAIVLFRWPEIPRRHATRLAAVTGLVVGAAGVIYFDRKIFLWECLMGISLVLGLMGWRMEQLGAPPKLLSIWIYVTHGIFVQVLRHLVLPARSAANAESFWIWNVVLFGLTLGGLVLGYHLIRRTLLGRILITPHPLHRVSHSSV